MSICPGTKNPKWHKCVVDFASWGAQLGHSDGWSSPKVGDALRILAYCAGGFEAGTSLLAFYLLFACCLLSASCLFGNPYLVANCSAKPDRRSPLPR